MASIWEYIDFLRANPRWYTMNENFYEGNEPLLHSMNFKTFLDTITAQRAMDLRSTRERDDFNRAWDNLDYKAQVLLKAP